MIEQNTVGLVMRFLSIAMPLGAAPVMSSSFDHGHNRRYLLSDECSNAVSDFQGRSNTELDQASQDMLTDLQTAIGSQDKETSCFFDGDDCTIDQNGFDSTAAYNNACVQEAGGSILEYNVRVRCKLRLDADVDESLDQVVYNIWNVDHCAPTMGCTADDVANVTEQEGEALGAWIEENVDGRLLFGSKAYDEAVVLRDAQPAGAELVVRCYADPNVEGENNEKASDLRNTSAAASSKMGTTAATNIAWVTTTVLVILVASLFKY